MPPILTPLETWQLLQTKSTSLVPTTFTPLGASTALGEPTRYDSVTVPGRVGIRPSQDPAVHCPLG